MVEIQSGLYLATRNRAKYYRLISKFFMTPIQKDILFGLKREKFGELKESEVEGYPELKEGIEKVHEYVSGSDNDELVEELQEDYDKIFQGDFKPTESSQMNYGEERTKELRENLKEEYEDQGWEYEELGFEPDHISMESSFMFYLTKEIRKGIVDREAEKVQDLLSVTERLFTNHIINWVPSFAEEVYGKSSTPYFKGVAILTQAFVEIDKDILPMFLEEKESE